MKKSTYVVLSYLYEATYAPGQGVVPFVYASEAFPLYMRTLGMSFSTATTWTFSFALTFAWPSQLRAMTSTGAFCWYSAWCFIGATLAYFFIPETRGKSLEELDMVFAVPISLHGANKLHQIQYWLGLSSDRPRNMETIMRENFIEFSTSRIANDEEKMGGDFKQVQEIEHAVSPSAA